jgi:hypothetical protein
LPFPAGATRGARPGGSAARAATLRPAGRGAARARPDVGRLGLDIDRALGQRGEPLVGLAFLVECLLQQLGVLRESHLLGVRAHGAVPRYLVVLDVLRLGDQTGVQHVRVRLLLEELLRLLDEPFHADALLAARTLVEVGEDLLEPLDLPLGHAEVLTERGGQLLMRGRFDHLRQRLDDLLLGAVEVLQVFDVERLERVEFHKYLRFE